MSSKLFLNWFVTDAKRAVILKCQRNPHSHKCLFTLLSSYMPFLRDCFVSLTLRLRKDMPVLELRKDLPVLKPIMDLTMLELRKDLLVLELRKDLTVLEPKKGPDNIRAQEGPASVRVPKRT
ncbi:hypothetical protein BgiBS90_017750 [Biomphalaria glabrata]|nr:hypothetical protein BgiBS90_017750 [Biomphalaria glabrata]